MRIVVPTEIVVSVRFSLSISLVGGLWIYLVSYKYVPLLYRTNKE